MALLWGCCAFVTSDIFVVFWFGALAYFVHFDLFTKLFCGVTFSL